MISLWIILREVSGIHILKASSLRRKNSGIHHMQTFFWKRALLDNHIYLFLILLTLPFFGCIEPFAFCSISESGVSIFTLVYLLCYLDSLCQLLGSYGGQVLVVDPFEWAIWCSQRESYSVWVDSFLHRWQKFLWKGDLSDNNFFSSFESHVLFSFRCFRPFLFRAIS